MKPLFRIFQFSFGCRHRQPSAVFTIKKRTYQVCLKCGQEFGYSWALMHTTRSSMAPIAPSAEPSQAKPRAKTDQTMLGQIGQMKPGS